MVPFSLRMLLIKDLVNISLNLIINQQKKVCIDCIYTSTYTNYGYGL